MKKETLDKIEEKLYPYISNINDLTAGVNPSPLFYFMVNRFGDLIDPNNNDILSTNEIKKREKYYKIIKKVGTLVLKNKQVFENRYNLIDENDKREDNKIVLPNEPVIWVSNHAFKDDTLATILATYRHPYILFGSLPQFYNTFDGIIAYLNGVVMTNRKVRESRKASVKKACIAIQNGVDLMMFPEGVWNKSANDLLIHLWPGVYKIARETGAKVVPVAHYLSDMSGKDKSQQIHTVIDDPIDISRMEEKEALKTIRDTLGSWVYLMMERYGQTTTKELIGSKNPTDVWEEMLKERISTATRYDLEIELSADFRPKNIVRPEDVFEAISKIENINSLNIGDIESAKKLVKTKKAEDFQRRF